MLISGVYKIYIILGVRAHIYFLRQSTRNDGGGFTAPVSNPLTHNRIHIMDTKPVRIKHFSNLILFLQSQIQSYLLKSFLLRLF